jgi:hypothetical protein
MAAMTPADHRDRAMAPCLDRLRELPFVRGVRIAWEPASGKRQVDALVTLRTPRRSFTLGLEVKRSFLDRTATSALIAEALRLQREHRLPLLLAARYVPRPTGERLADAGVNFVDRVGNIHLRLGTDHHVLVLGRRNPLPGPAARRPSPALFQLLFVLLADPAAAGWTVRALAEAAGIGKTAAAAARQRLLGENVLRRGERTFHVMDRRKLADQFVDGYARILRSHLHIGRFRALERNPERLLEHIAHLARSAGLGWAVTGAPAAFALQRFYRDDQVPVFLTELRPEAQRELRLVPDREGPVMMFRAFGTHYAWREVGDLWVAHPWLIYAELVHRGEPRALDAAVQLREEYLKP